MNNRIRNYKILAGTSYQQHDNGNANHWYDHTND